MKKFLILALLIFTVIFMATAVMAAELSYEGKVSVKWANDPTKEEDSTGFAQDKLEAKVVFDYEEDFGDGVTAGVKTKMEAHKDKQFIFDGGGWIKADYDLFSVKAATEIEDGVGKDFGEYKVGKGPGVEVVAKPADGFTLTGIVNGGYAAGYRLLAKGEYAADLFNVGGGFHTERSTANKDWARTGLGVYGSYKVMDNLTVKGEYGSRKKGAAKDEDALTAILANAKYDDGVIMADASYLTVSKDFDFMKDDDLDEWRARDAVKNGNWKASAVFVDASYALSNTLKVLGSLDYILAAEDANKNGKDLTKDKTWDSMSYKVGVESQLTDQLKAEGWYKGYGKHDDNDDAHAQLGAKATYTFADGVEGSFELTNGRAWGDAEAYTRYTAKLTATL